MKRDKVINRALSIFFTILSLAWIYPVFMIALNSFKKATAISTTTAFDLLTPETFNGLANYMHALNEQGFASAFMYSLIITVTSVVLILVCCSMCAWYVVRVNNKISNFFYYLFVFSMVVPFQMLMFTLSNLADRIGFNTPFNICFIYLGFGAGLAVFMFGLERLSAALPYARLHQVQDHSYLDPVLPRRLRPRRARPHDGLHHDGRYPHRRHVHPLSEVHHRRRGGRCRQGLMP